MPKRVFVDKQVPTAYKALSAVAAEVRAAAADAGLDRAFMELINVRVSQMNRCVFCLDLHSRLAIESGVTTQRLAILPAWRDTELFDAKEKAALRLAEAVTAVGGEHLDDAAPHRVAEDVERVRAELVGVGPTGRPSHTGVAGSLLNSASETKENLK